MTLQTVVPPTEPSAPPPLIAEPRVGLFGRLAAWILGHRRFTIIAAIVVSLASALVSLRIGVDSNIVSLMPENDPASKALDELNAKEGGVGMLTLTVGGGTLEERHAWLEAVSQRLAGYPEVRSSFHQMDKDLAVRVGLLQLTPSELGEIRDRLRGAVMLGPAILNPFVAQEVLSLGHLTGKISQAGFYVRLNPGDDMSRLIVRPTGAAMDLPFARRLMADVNKVLAELPATDRGLEVLWVGGAYRHAVEDYEGILRDVKWTSAGATILVLLVVTLGFRSFRSVALVFFPNLLANLWTLGFAAAAVGNLNTFTSFFNAVVIGLGIAYPVPLYSRYREERASGLEVERAIVRAWDRVGMPCFSAAATSAAAFSSLFLARFRGFQQLGLLTAVGVLLSLLAAATLLPLLIPWLDRTPVRAPSATGPVVESKGRRRVLVPLGLLLAFAVTVGSAFEIHRIGFQYDISELRRNGLAWSDLDSVRQSLARDSFAPLVATFQDDAALRKAQDAATKDIAEGRFPEVAQALSIYSVIPADQEERVAVLRQIAEIAGSPEARFLPKGIKDNLAPLVASPVRPLTSEDLPLALRGMIGIESGQPRMLLMAAGNQWDRRESARLHDAVLARYPDIPVAGEFLCLGSLYHLMRTDAPKVCLAAFLLIAGFTFLDLRRPVRTLAALGVLLGGACWAAGAIGLLGIKLSIVNVVGIPMILGTTVDVIIHLLHRLEEEGPGRVAKALSTTGWAAALTNLTDALGFGVLLLAGSQGVRSLGLLVSVGLAAVTLAAFVLVPLGWLAIWRVAGHRPAPTQGGA
jgi:uncharacterized protein